MVRTPLSRSTARVGALPQRAPPSDPAEHHDVGGSVMPPHHAGREVGAQRRGRLGGHHRDQHRRGGHARAEPSPPGGDEQAGREGHDMRRPELTER